MTRCRRSSQWLARAMSGLTLCVATTAHAEQTSADGARPSHEANDEAIKAFFDGKAHFEAGRFEQAREQFHRAHLLTKDPDLLYNLGQTYRKLGQCARARDAYEQFLQAATTSQMAERARKHIAALQSSCVSPDAEGSGDEPSPASPAPTAAAAPAASAVPIPAPRASPPQGPPVRDATLAEPHARAGWRSWTWVTLVSGLAAGGTALGLGIYNQQRYGEWKAEHRRLAPGAASEDTADDWLSRQNANDRLSRSIDAAQRATIITGVAGAVLVVASGVMFWVTPIDSPGPTQTAGLAPALRLGAALRNVTSTSVTLSGTF